MTPSKLIVGITVLSLSCGCGSSDIYTIERELKGRISTQNAEEN